MQMAILGEQEFSTKFEQKILGLKHLCILNGHYVFQEIDFKRKTFQLELSKPVLEVLCNI